MPLLAWEDDPTNYVLIVCGPTLTELTNATGWQPHSARAFLTGLRKKGSAIVRESRTSGDTCWRIER